MSAEMGNGAGNGNNNDSNEVDQARAASVAALPFPAAAATILALEAEVDAQRRTTTALTGSLIRARARRTQLVGVLRGVANMLRSGHVVAAQQTGADPHEDRAAVLRGLAGQIVELLGEVGREEAIEQREAVEIRRAAAAVLPFVRPFVVPGESGDEDGNNNEDEDGSEAASAITTIAATTEGLRRVPRSFDLVEEARNREEAAAADDKKE